MRLFTILCLVNANLSHWLRSYSWFKNFFLCQYVLCSQRPVVSSLLIYRTRRTWTFSRAIRFNQGNCQPRDTGKGKTNFIFNKKCPTEDREAIIFKVYCSTEKLYTLTENLLLVNLLSEFKFPSSPPLTFYEFSSGTLK